MVILVNGCPAVATPDSQTEKKHGWGPLSEAVPHVLGLIKPAELLEILLWLKIIKTPKPGYGWIVMSNDKPFLVPLVSDMATFYGEVPFSSLSTAQSPDLLLWIPDPRFRNVELCCRGVRLLSFLGSKRFLWRVTLW